MTLPDITLDKLKDWVVEKRPFIENFVSLVDKNTKVVPFRFNASQQDYWPKRSPRDIILKAGQLGFTSLVDVEFLIDCLTIPGTVSIVVAHEEFITQRLLARVKFFESTIPKGLKPELHHKSSYELTWPDVNSTFYIGSARSYVFGRAEHISNFHASEYAFWPDPEKILKPVLDRANRIIIESTPFGEETPYHQIVQEALTGDSIWRIHFYPWWWGEDNRYTVDSEICLPKDRKTPLDWTDEELQLKERVIRDWGMVLDEEQIRWRRAKISQHKEDFWQENPEDVDTCFYSTTEMVFDKEVLDKLLLECYPAPFTYENSQIWYPPMEGCTYVIGVDPTVGVIDSAAASVWNTRTEQPRHEATLYGLYPPHILSEKLIALGKHYNNAMLSVEANNCGLAVLTDLKDYRNLYYRRDLQTGAERGGLGWLTTDATKNYMTKVYNRKLPTIITHDRSLVRESRNTRYIMSKTGTKAVTLGEDHLLIASMIALATIDFAPRSDRGYVGSGGWTW